MTNNFMEAYMKAIMKQRDGIQQIRVWNEMINAPKFNMKKMYLAFHDSSQTVAWRTLFYGNLVRPRALVNIWLACNERLATRERLQKYEQSFWSLAVIVVPDSHKNTK
jgi:hypothetical protein